MGNWTNAWWATPPLPRSPRPEGPARLGTAPVPAGLLLTGLLLGGCAAAPPLPDAPHPFTPPAGFRTAPPGPGASEQVLPPRASPWWKALGDPQLDRFVELAWRHNRDLGMAKARIDQARALANADRAAGAPSVGLNPQAARSRTSRNVDPGVEVSGLSGGLPAVSVTPDTYGARARLPLDFAYEIDLWGRLRLTAEASGQRAAASAHDLELARQALAASVVIAHRRLVTHLRQLPLTEEGARLWERRLDALEAQAAVGRSDGSTLDAARIGAADARTQLHRLRERVALDRHALALLCGQAPGDLPPLEGTFEAPLPMLAVPADLPSQVLQRRPDVRSAQARLDAAWQDVGAARADFFPSLRLTGSTGLESSALAELLQPGSLVWSLGAQISASVFDGGRREARFAAARARLDEAALQYESTVLQALREVEDALSSVASLEAQEKQAAAAVESADRLAHRARLRADVGLLARLDEIEQRQVALQRRQQLLDVQAEVLAAQVTLFKALAHP